MPDAFETQVKIRFNVPAGEVERVKRLVEASMSPSFMTRLKGSASVFSGMPMKGLAMAGAGFGALVVSSPALQNTLKVIANTLAMIVRPIGDIVAVGLRPIIDILRPIGMFFRILIKPYIDKAREAMTLGRQFAARGEYGLAGQAYAAGAAYLLKPFFDMMVTITTVGVQGVLSGIKLLGSALLAVLDPLDWVRSSFSDTMDSAILAVGEGGARIIVETSVMMERWLVTLKENYKLIENHAKLGMGNTQAIVGEGFVRIIETATMFFVPNMKSITASMFDSIVAYGVQKVNELNSALSKKTTYSTASTGMSYSYYPPTWNVPYVANPFAGAGGGGSSGAGDFIWRPGQAPLKFSSNDTIMASKSGEGKQSSITIGDIIIRIDRVSSDIDERRLGGMVRDEVVNALRTMV